MSLQDSNRAGDPICKICVSYYDCLLDNKEECEEWQMEQDSAMQDKKGGQLDAK